MIFQIKTTATMKPHNNKKWWIDSGIIREITVDAESIQKALEQYRDRARDSYGVDISKNAIINKKPMFRDDENGFSQQCGYVITAKTNFNNDYKGWVTHYIDLWVNVAVIVNPFGEV